MVSPDGQASVAVGAPQVGAGPEDGRLLHDGIWISEERAGVRARFVLAVRGKHHVVLFTAADEHVFEARIAQVREVLASTRLAARSLAELVDLGMREMEAKSRFLRQLLPAAGGRLDVDHAKGEVVFTDPSGAPAVRGRFELLGTHSMASRTWSWAWADPSAAEERTSRARVVRDYGEEAGVVELANPDVYAATPEAAQDLAAAAIRLTGAQAWYRAPISPTSTVYLVFTELSSVGAGAGSATETR
jgi:hypothetical protein